MMGFKSESASLLLLFLSNLWYAITKKSLASAIPIMKKEIGFTNKNIGECSANFSLLYGSFKLVGGVLADIFPADYLFTLGLALGSLINIFIPIVSHGKYISYFWGLNGLLQGMGGPALSKVVIDNIPADRKAAIWSNLFTANNIGYFSSPYMLLIPLRLFGWQGPFWFAGIIGLLIAVLSWTYPISTCLHHTAVSSSQNLEQKDSESHNKHANNTVCPAFKQPRTTTLLSQCSRFLATMLLILSNAVTYFIIKAISDWKVPYLLETTSMDITVAMEIVVWCEVGGMCGAYIAGCVADFFPSSSASCRYYWIYIHAVLLTTFFLLLLLPPPDHSSLTTTNTLPAQHIVHTIREYLIGNNNTLSSFPQNSWSFRRCLFAISFGMNAPKALLLLHATEASVLWCKPYLQQRVPTGTISGWIGFVAQIGASGSGHIMGYYLDQSFHSYFHILFLATSILLVCLVLSYIFFVVEEMVIKTVVKENKQKEKDKEQ